MDLTINEVHTNITQLLERTKKFIVVEEKEKMKDGGQELNIGRASGKCRFRKGKNFKVGKMSKWVLNKVYQTSGNPPSTTLDK